ncbi:MAG: flotillin family protein [Anaerolineae bacterium]|nr:flotillin family protein [Anaerolineae bacterium]
MPALGGIALLVLFFVLIAVLVVYLSRIRTVGPNEVLIISGRKRTFTNPLTGEPEQSSYRIVKAGRAFIWPVIEQVDVLSLELLTIEVSIDDVYTMQGVAISLDGVAQIKIASDDTSIGTAAERFLSKTRAELKEVAHETLAGHLRAIVGTLTVEEIYRERDKFAQSVQEVSSDDLKNMGLAIDSFVIKDIRDREGYLDALGRPRIADVKRKAVIAEQEAAAEEEAARRDYGIKKAEYDREVARQRAESDLAHQLQSNITNQQVTAEAVQVEIISKQRQIELQEQEALRMERELEATVRKPAEAEKYRRETIANAERYQIEALAEGQANAARTQGIADADVIKQRGMAEAEIIRQQGLAEAEAMQRKAAAWQEYNQAAIIQQLIDVMPQIAAAIAEPLSRTERIVIISSGDGANGGAGASKISADIANIVAQVPELVEALTGMDLTETIKHLPGVITTDAVPITPEETGETSPEEPENEG